MALFDIGSERATGETFREFLEQLRERLGVEHAAYAGMDQSGGDIRGFVTYSHEWVDHYRKNNLAGGDPTLRLASRSIAPLDWGRIPKLASHGDILDQASEFGISRNGVTVPVRGPYGDIGMLSVSMRGSPEHWKRHQAEIIRDLQSAAVHVHDNVIRVFGHQMPGTRPLLSSRELEILQWTAAGKTQRDIGTILSISDRTVEVHLRSARTKLYALTTAQAVARAISARLIEADC